MGDLIAGVSVALVAVPQALAYADLAGMPPAVGLPVAAVAGLAAAPLASSPYLQTGPVAITALLAYGALAPLAEPGAGRYVLLAAVLAVLVGVIRLAIGLSRSGDLAYFMSEPVVVGFTVAAVVVIIATQVPALVGVDAVAGGPILAAVVALVRVDAWHVPTVAMGGAVLGVALLGQWLVPRLPVIVVAVVASIAVARAGWYPGEVVGALPAVGPGLPGLPDLADVGSLIVPALVIAIIGFGDVAAIGRVYATATRTRWDADREFVAQGAANIASGLVGGFPVGGSFSRTAIAVNAGARTAWAGAISSLTVLAIVPAAALLADLPVATLAAVVVAAVLRLADVRPVLALRRYSRQQFVISTATVLLTLLLAPQVQWALIAGIALSIVAHLRRELLIGVPVERHGDVVHLHPTGVLYFASAHRLLDQMREVVADREVDRLVVHLDRLGRVDVTGALAVRDFVREARGLGIDVMVVDATAPSRKIIDRVLDGDHPSPEHDARGGGGPGPGRT